MQNIAMCNEKRNEFYQQMTFLQKIISLICIFFQSLSQYFYTQLAKYYYYILHFYQWGLKNVFSKGVKMKVI